MCSLFGGKSESNLNNHMAFKHFVISFVAFSLYMFALLQYMRCKDLFTLTMRHVHGSVTAYDTFLFIISMLR